MRDTSTGGDLPLRVLLPVCVGLVIAVGGALVAWDAGGEVLEARHLASSGVSATAHDAEGSTARGRPVDAVVGLAGEARRLRLVGATADAGDLAPGTVVQEASAAWRPVRSGPYAGAFAVLHDPDDVDRVMAATDVDRVLADTSTRTVAVVAAAASAVATAALLGAAAVAFRRARRGRAATA